MSESTEKTSETQENTAESKAEAQATEANAGQAPTEAQENVAPAEEKSESKPEKSTKAKETPSAAKEKPLEKMTVKELREIAKDIPGMTGVHAMKKEELISGIKEAKGIEDEPTKKTAGSTQELKLKIKALKAERQAALEAKDKKKATIFRRRISRLKKKTRKVAA
jgi:protein-arginine kinase activator protein McsA